MIDYYSYPVASIVRVLNPNHQIVGGKFNNVAFGIPSDLLSRYFRRARPDLDPPVPEWWLDANDPAWDELLSYREALDLYSAKPKPSAGPPGHAESLAAAKARKEARQVWWAQARALFGADDPDWRYGSHDDDPEHDDDIYLQDLNVVDSKPRFPRVDLRLKYGTANFIKWASGKIGPMPS